MNALFFACNEWQLSARIVVRSAAKHRRLTLFHSTTMLNEEPFASAGRGAEQKALKGFCVIIPACLIPRGSKKERRMEGVEESENEAAASVFTHIPADSPPS